MLVAACRLLPPLVFIGGRSAPVAAPAIRGTHTVRRLLSLMIHRHTRRDNHKANTPPEQMVMDPRHRKCRCPEQTKATNTKRECPRFLAIGELHATAFERGLRLVHPTTNSRLSAIPFV